MILTWNENPLFSRALPGALLIAAATGAPVSAQEDPAPRPYQFGLAVTGFADSLVSGDGNNAAEPGGKADLTFRLNGEAAGLWQGLFISAHLEHNFGQDVNTQGDGTILPVNTAMAFPRLGGSDTNFSLTITQVFNENTSFTFGKFNMLEAASATPLIGGGGTETFQNIGLAAPVSGVTPPYVLGGLLAVKTSLADLSFFVYDPRNAQDSDVLENPFSDGTTLSISGTVPVAPGGLNGSHGLRLVYSSASGLDFDSIPQLILPPGSGDVLTKEKGYWYASYNMQQYLVQDASGAGWGVFGQIAISDGNPNPVRASALAGVGGDATFFGRNTDRWGVAGFYYNFSDDLEDGLDAIGSGLRDEYGLEAFYEAEITSNFRVGLDLQTVRPGTPGSDWATFVNLRARLIF